MEANKPEFERIQTGSLSGFVIGFSQEFDRIPK